MFIGLVLADQAARDFLWWRGNGRRVSLALEEPSDSRWKLEYMADDTYRINWDPY